MLPTSKQLTTVNHYQALNETNQQATQWALSPLARAVRASLICLSMASGVSHAATIEVTSNLDTDIQNSSICTLRSALRSFEDGSTQSGCINGSADAFGINDSITFSNSSIADNIITLDGNQLSFFGTNAAAKVMPFNQSVNQRSANSNFNSGLTIDASNITGGITVDANRRSRVISVFYSPLRMVNMTITGGQIDSRESGAGIRVSDAHVELNQVTVTANSTTNNEGGDGGGIYAVDGATVSLVNSTVSDNQASLSGGGIAVRESSITLVNSQVTGNNASDDGGGLTIRRGEQPAMISLVNSEVSFNSAENGGGIAERTGFGGPAGTSSISLVNTRVSSNAATRYGGGIAVVRSAAPNVSVNLINSTVFDNYADIDGGGIYAGGQFSVTLENTTVSANTASIDGGGIAVLQSDGSLSSENSYLGLVRSTISNNAASVDGGGVIALRASLNATNSTISGNSAQDDAGGVLATQQSSLRFENVTVSDNSAPTRGGGILLFAGTEAFIGNSIIANSSGDLDCRTGSGAVVSVDSASIIGDGSCSASRFGDPGILPLANNGGPTMTHALSEESVARNSSVGNCPTTDQRGQARDVSDGFCDVGAFEFTVPVDTSFFVVPLKNGNSVIFEL